MGRIKENHLSGAIGTVVYYVLNGKPYVRSKPRSRKKPPTAIMKVRNGLFSDVAGPSSRMLKYMKKEFLFRVGFADYNRLRGWMYVLYSINHAREEWPVVVDNNMCQLNPAAELRQFFKADITMSDDRSEGISVSFPSFDPQSVIRAPLGAKKVTIKVITASSPTDTAPVRYAKESFSFDLTDTIVPAREILLKTEGDKGDLVIVVLAIEFGKSGREIITDPRWLPAAVIAMGRIKL